MFDGSQAAPDPAADYALIREALALMSKTPALTVEELARRLGRSPDAFARSFRRFCGLPPKDFLQAVRLDRARRLLAEDASVLEASLALGLSGPARLHDLFVTHEALSPGEWKAGGAGLRFACGFHPSPFGEALLVVTPRGLAGLGFVDPEGLGRDRDAALADMAARWPFAKLAMAPQETAPYADRIFDPALWRPEMPLRVVLIGRDFEVRVWETLLTIPFGRVTSYGRLAARLGKPGAARAVGAAVGRNPVSFVVPCHRVVGADGTLTGYHWGLTRKRAMLGWEWARGR